MTTTQTTTSPTETLRSIIAKQTWQQIVDAAWAKIDLRDGRA